MELRLQHEKKQDKLYKKKKEEKKAYLANYCKKGSISR